MNVIKIFENIIGIRSGPHPRILCEGPDDPVDAKMPTCLHKARKKRGHVSCGHGRIGKLATAVPGGITQRLRCACAVSLSAAAATAATSAPSVRALESCGAGKKGAYVVVAAMSVALICLQIEGAKG